MTAWCRGEISFYTIAEIIHNFVDMTMDEIVNEMKRGCEKLIFNDAVIDFAKAQQSLGLKTALVTVNVDMFTETVVPAHSLNEMFDIIVNSADVKTDDKLELWPIAFDYLGPNIDYESSLLIDDSIQWVKRFIEKKGFAYRYTNDFEFIKWQCKNNYL